MLKDLFKYFGTLIIVIDNVMYLIIYFYVNIGSVWIELIVAENLKLKTENTVAK